MEVNDFGDRGDIVIHDPLHDYLGPSSGNKVLGDPSTEDIPDEIISVLDEFGLHSGRSFRVIVKELADGVDDPAHGSYIKGFSRTIPTVDWIGRNYGPGRYCLVFQWRSKDEESGKMGNKTERVIIEVSEKFESEYREFQHQEKLRRLKKRKESVQDALLESKIESSILTEEGGESRDSKQSAREYVNEMLSFNEKLGLRRGGIDWEKILPVVLTGLPLALKALSEVSASRQNQQNQLMTLMLTQSNNYNSQLVEVMKNLGPQNGSDTMKEFREMLTSAIDMKELLHGEKKDSLADKIFSLVESVSPQLLQVASLSAQARQSDPRVAMARQYIATNPDFQALADSPESKSNLVRRLDGYYGWKQTDAILQVMGWQRPEGCPRRPEQESPTAGGSDGSEGSEGSDSDDVDDVMGEM